MALEINKIDYCIASDAFAVSVVALSIISLRCALCSA